MWGWLFGSITKFVTGGGLGGLASELRQAQKDKLDAENDKDRLQSAERIEKLQTQMLAQTTGDASWLPKMVRAAWTAPFVIFTVKVLVWDKVLGWGVTDPMGSYEQTLGLLIAGFYFFDATISKFRR